MDRVIPEKEQIKDKRKTYFRWLLAAGAVALSVYGVSQLLTKSVARRDILIGVVQRGEISLEVSGRGRIEPVYQQALTAPFSTVLIASLKTVGDQVQDTTAILNLDRTAEQSRLQQMMDEAELKKTELRKEKLRLKKELYELETETAVKSLELETLSSNLASEQKLLEIGGTTEESVSQAATALKVAKLRQQKLQNDWQVKQLAVKEEIRALEIALEIQQQHIADQERKLEKAKMQAGIDGAITFVNDKVGASIQEGEVLARIANLKAFRVRGLVAESYSQRVSVGMKARINTSQEEYLGEVSSMSPSSENGMVTVFLNIDPNSAIEKLRPDMVVDIALMEETRDSVLKVENRGAFKGKVSEELFVIRGDKAERVKVTTGYRNDDWVEIKTGLQEGDSVIVSNTERFEQSPYVSIEN
ncbi:HlyD family efflux transporter periplasmic adaptor subunit [Limibacter armeniacum]|uniref:efflux RND transporter periplasmic adaptor subunit n=1 Tax=Limibacter armeniacum TaxID=466084 RepID=UPI002FE6855E